VYTSRVSDDPAQSYLAKVQAEQAAQQAAKKAGRWVEPTDHRRRNRIIGAIEIGAGIAMIVVGIAIGIVGCTQARDEAHFGYQGPRQNFPLGQVVGAIAAGAALAGEGGHRRWRNREDD